MAKKLEDFHIDLAIHWRAYEGLTWPQINERLVEFFGPEVSTSPENLLQRCGRREDQYKEGVVVKHRILQPQNLDNENMLDWIRSKVYEKVYIADVQHDQGEFRRTTDLLLKVLRAQKDLVGAETEDEEEKIANALLKAVQGGNDKADEEYGSN